MKPLDVILTIVGYLVTIYCIKKSSGKLRIQATAWLYNLLTRLLIGSFSLLVYIPFIDFKFTIFIFQYLVWILIILSVISLMLYLKTKNDIYKYYFVFMVLYILFGLGHYLEWIILGYLLLSLYNQKNKRKE